MFLCRVAEMFGALCVQVSDDIEICVYIMVQYLIHFLLNTNIYITFTDSIV